MRGVLSADANMPASSVGRLAFANGAVRGVAACLVWMLIVKLRKENQTSIGQKMALKP